MSKGTEGHFDTLPIGRLGLIPLNSSAALGKKVDDYLVSWRKGRGNEFAEKYVAAYEGYERDSYIIQSQVPRFGSGEAKGIINESVRGDDIYILLDVCNYSLTYSLCGYTNHMSPDDHFQDLKRVIAACNGKARRINVIMPFLYEGRQHRRSGRESLDCAYALEELRDMGIDNFITFDAHDPRVQNSTPLNGFDNFTTPYQFIKSLLNSEDDMIVDKDHLLVISPDEGALDRAIYFASVLGGSVIAESIFAIPGISSMALEAIRYRDYPVLQAYVLVSGCTLILVMVTVDLLIAYLNPKVKLGERS